MIKFYCSETCFASVSPFFTFFSFLLFFFLQDDKKVTVRFIRDNLLKNGVVIATGNQREYDLTFATEEMCSQFIQCMQLFVNSTVCLYVNIVTVTCGDMYAGGVHVACMWRRLCMWPHDMYARTVRQ